MRLCAILAVATVTVALLRTPLSAQVPRDAARRPEAAGTAVIRGRVIAGDTGNPIRRGRVNLQVVAPLIRLDTPSGPSAPSSATVLSSRDGSPATPRQTVTDGDGAFEFRNVVPGAYRIFASPGQYSGQYVSISYGAKPSNTPLGSDLGVPIQIADGQIFDKSPYVEECAGPGCSIMGGCPSCPRLTCVARSLPRAWRDARFWPCGSPRWPSS